MAPKQATLGYVKTQQTLGCGLPRSAISDGSDMRLIFLQQVLWQSRRTTSCIAAVQTEILKG
jgi:hypothetical protein